MHIQFITTSHQHNIYRLSTDTIQWTTTTNRLHVKQKTRARTHTHIQMYMYIEISRLTLISTAVLIIRTCTHTTYTFSIQIACHQLHMHVLNKQLTHWLVRWLYVFACMRHVRDIYLYQYVLHMCWFMLLRSWCCWSFPSYRDSRCKFSTCNTTNCCGWTFTLNTKKRYILPY